MKQDTLQIVNVSFKNKTEKQIKSGILFQEKIYNVEMKQDTLQIVNVSFKNKTEKQIEAVVEYAPYDFNFKDNKVKSLSLFKEEIKDGSQGGVKQNSETQQSTAYKEIKENLKENNKFDIEFDKFGNYELKFIYKFEETSSSVSQPDVQASNVLSTSESENENMKLNSLTKEQFQNSDDLSLSGEGEGTSGVGSTGSDDQLQNNQDSSTSGEDNENGGSDSQGDGSSGDNQEPIQPEKKPPVEKVETYNHKFDVFSLELRDVVLSEVKLNFTFAKHYTVKKGDKIKNCGW